MKQGRAHLKAPEASYYDRIFRTHPHFNQHYSRSRYLPVWEAVIEELSDRARILEIGCGTGQFAALLHDRGFREYRGFDFSSSAIARARKTVPDFDFRVADARDPTAYEGDHDTVVATEVLEHLDDDLAVLRLLAPGTTVHFTVPTKNDPSHVRFFPRVAGVRARYSAHLEDLDLRTMSQWHVGVGRTPRK